MHSPIGDGTKGPIPGRFKGRVSPIHLLLCAEL